MNVEDLEWQADSYGGVNPRVVDSLLERGHLELVVQATGEREDWFCARGAARVLQAAGEFGRAWEVMRPFAESGWLPAVSVGAGILLQCGRVDEALALARPDGEGREQGEACKVYAEVLVGAGQVDAAIDVLVPHLRDERLLSSLVEMTEGQGKDERVLDLVTSLAEEARRMHAEGRRESLGRALDLQADVLERSGRVDEAIAVLGADVAARRSSAEIMRASYARLLARHRRIEDLHQMALGDHEYTAFRPLVTALEEAGRPEEAESLLREYIPTTNCPGNYQNLLMELLVRQGRLDDAVEAARPTFEDRWDGLLQAAVLMLAEHGRHAQALQLLEERSPEFLEESAHWVPSSRWWLMGESGRCREAIAEIASALDLESDERDTTVAWLLAQDGRLDEAINLLRSCSGDHATQLAELLVRRNRPLEALAVIPGAASGREAENRRREKNRRRGTWNDTGDNGGRAEESGRPEGHRGCTDDPLF
ncbi:tetratricopeptide repeat protein [Streptomyces sp. st140]|uniref:tetratricopeptide repeat protein n=1 Tax=Streptomyces sp. st140 TaxID=1828052 RepID=UPI0015CF1485|nr:tetratricopeptide repeat protein [Streptomyces sp. st140]